MQQKYPLFVHQMPLEPYFKKCEAFLNCADAYMEQNFKVESANDVNGNDGDHNDYSEIVQELEDVQNRFVLRVIINKI